MPDLLTELIETAAANEAVRPLLNRAIAEIEYLRSLSGAVSNEPLISFNEFRRRLAEQRRPHLSGDVGVTISRADQA